MDHEERKQRLRSSYARYKSKEANKEKAKVARAAREEAHRERNKIELPKGSKRCPACNIDKDYSHFHVLLSSADGRQARCKQCIAENSRINAESIAKKSAAWYEKNKEDVNRRRRELRRANIEFHRARSRKWRLDNPEKAKEVVKKSVAKRASYYKQKRIEWVLLNKGRVAEISRRWRANRPPNPVIIAQRNAKWRQENPEKARVLSRIKRAKKRSAEGRHTAREIENLLAKQKFKCVGCLTSIKKSYHADHIVALSRGGSNWISNIQLLCPHCNLTKHSKDHMMWAQERGRLL